MKWIAITDRSQPERGEKVVAVNAVREWVTKWNPALLTGTYPVTHVAKLERPYEPTVPDFVVPNPGGKKR